MLAPMKDPYETLGVAKTATPEEIKKAYLRLAKKFHPDLNPGDKHVEEKFKEVSSANDFLSDPDKRRRYDAGEIDAAGVEKPQHRFYKDYAEASGHPYETQSAYADFADADNFFADLLRRRTHEGRRARGADQQYRLEIDFLEAVNGAKKEIALPQGGRLDVTKWFHTAQARVPEFAPCESGSPDGAEAAADSPVREALPLFPAAFPPAARSKTPGKAPSPGSAFPTPRKAWAW